MQPGTPPRLLVPRLLVRRAIAFALDHTLALLLVTLLILPFTDRGLRLPQPLFHLRTVTCTELDTPPDWLAPRLAEAQLHTLRLCENRLWGLPNGREVLAIWSTPEGDQRLTRMERVPVDANLTPVPLPDLSAALVFLVMGLASALLLLRGWQSPGKALCGLRIVPRDQPRPFRREAARLGPLTLLMLVTALWPFAPPLLWPLPALIATSAGVSLALIALHVWPFVHWTGQSRHDRAGRTEVRRR